MKAFFRNNKIVLKKDDDYNMIEGTITEISKEFERLKACCEDRSLDLFPVDIIRRIVDKGNKISQMGKEIEVSEKLLEYATQNKEILGFFKSKIEEYNKEMADFNAKKNILCKFSMELKKL